MGKTRIVSIVQQNPKNVDLTHQQIEEKTAKCMEGKGHIAEGISRWDFLDKNKWTLNTVMGNPDEVISGSFDCVHGCTYLTHLCEECEGVFRLPFKADKCIFCDRDTYRVYKNKITMRDPKGRAGVSSEVNPDLYQQAVKDIQENGTPESNEPAVDIDWKHLEENV